MHATPMKIAHDSASLRGSSPNGRDKILAIIAAGAWRRIAWPDGAPDLATGGEGETSRGGGATAIRPLGM